MNVELDSTGLVVDEVGRSNYDPFSSRTHGRDLTKTSALQEILPFGIVHRAVEGSL
jgi:hypothetical protein